MAFLAHFSDCDYVDYDYDDTKDKTMNRGGKMMGWVHLCMITNMIMMTTIMLILIIMMLIIMMITIIMITIMTIEMMMSEGDRWVGLAPPFYPIILKFDLMIMIATIQRQ